MPDCTWVNHLYDRPGRPTCECVDPYDPCLYNGACVHDTTCADVNACVWVNHRYDRPGQLTCECIDPHETCFDYGHCVLDARCEPRGGKGSAPPAEGRGGKGSAMPEPTDDAPEPTDDAPRGKGA